MKFAVLPIYRWFFMFVICIVYEQPVIQLVVFWRYNWKRFIEPELISVMFVVKHDEDIQRDWPINIVVLMGNINYKIKLLGIGTIVVNVIV